MEYNSGKKTETRAVKEVTVKQNLEIKMIKESLEVIDQEEMALIEEYARKLKEEEIQEYLTNTPEIYVQDRNVLNGIQELIKGSQQMIEEFREMRKEFKKGFIEIKNYVNELKEEIEELKEANRQTNRIIKGLKRRREAEEEEFKEQTKQMKSKRKRN